MGSNLLPRVIFLFITAQAFFKTVSSVPDVHGRREHYRLRRDTEPLSFKEKPSNKTVPTGQTSQIGCSAQHDDITRQNWYKEDELLAPPFSGSIFVLPNHNLLVVGIEANMGRFTCVLERGEETISADIWITLQTEVAFLETPSDATVQFGESHIFPCLAEGAVDISWTKDGQPSDTFIDGDRVLQHRGDLVFTAVSLADSGRYSCKARSVEGDGSIEAQAILKVDVDVDNVCGRPFHPHGPDGFVVGGTEVTHGAFPWQAMLWDIRPARNKFFCSGSLLNGRWVITAAHCIRESGVRKDDFIVRLGRHTTTRGVFEQTESSHRVEKIIVHPDFNGYTYDSDIALLKLSGPEVTFTEYILPICLPDVLDARSLVRSGQLGTVTGWGATEDGGSHTTTLRKVSLPLVSLGRCRHAHPQFADGISKNMFCAGRTSGGRDACEGDSGGPFAAYDSGRWKLLGIVSWGDGCALQGKYGVYTRVHRFREWISSYVDKPDPGDDGGNDIIPCNRAPCQNNARCVLAEDRESGYYCYCPSGFEGRHCETVHPEVGGESIETTPAPAVTTTTIQIDPCDSEPCQNGGECFSNDAGYRCFCPEDWHGDNCEIRKPCFVNPCLNDGICQENGDDFTCLCYKGWKGETCEVVDPCYSNPCTRGICTPGRANPETFACSCPRGWTGGTCNTDINECRKNPCGPSPNRCINQPGSFVCICATGFEAKGTTCVDRNECSGRHDCEHICKNTQGSYRCECRAGFTLDRNKKTCTDIDECTGWWKGGPCEYTCENNPGSYKCSCREGYKLDKDDHICVDIDECSTGWRNKGPCAYKCFNNMGSYVCYCGSRYELSYDGHNCVDEGGDTIFIGGDHDLLEYDIHEFGVY